ncbi:caspase family protein [Leptolyngbya sp. PL-A3]|uniref:caspase family protein n=1 Tax=Leptolyngbya sp. PL-A3 TaxID=2933911 RepID=UPI00329769C4
MPIRKRWAFLVGINRYTAYSSLSYCVDDILALAKLLEAAGYVTVCLHDRLDAENRRFPTVDNIREEFKSLCKAIKDGENQGQDDLLLVYFACHGTRTSDGQPRLVSKDTRKNLLEDRAISITEIEAGMEMSGAGCRILMLDACHIGLGKTNTRAPEDPELLRKIHDLAKGYALLAASTDQQDAHEWDGVKHGIFSFYVLSGLSGEADLHGKNYVTVNDLSGYILSNLQDWRVRQGVDQVPQGRVEGNLGDFILVDGYQNNPSLITPEIVPTDNSALAQGIQSRGRSPSQIVECLWSLNCKSQCDEFGTGPVRPRRAAAFVVQAKDTRIQQWLVKRLVNQIPNVANAKVFPIVVPSHPMWKRRNFDELWLDLSRKLECPADPTSVIDALVQIYRTKPIIIAMYGWTEMARSQTLQQDVLTKLWQPLVKAIGALEEQPVRSRAILLLAEGHDSAASASQVGSPDDADIPKRLAPLTEITYEHLADWMESDAVFSVLSQLMPQEQVELLIREEIQEWSTDPVQAIEQICYIFNLDNGIADIEAEWRLAG